MDRPRLAVVLSACLLASLLFADAALADAATDEHPSWTISEGEVVLDAPSPMRLFSPNARGENWTFFSFFVVAERGQVVQVEDVLQSMPYALYAFDTQTLRPRNLLPGEALPSPPTASAVWNASLLRPSVVRLAPLTQGGNFNGTEPTGTAPLMARATRTGTDPGGGILFVWANRTADQKPVETFGRLGFSATLAAGAQTFDPGLAALHPWFAAAEGVAFLGLAAAVAWLLRTGRREAPPPPLGPEEEMLALLERSEGYLRGLRNTAVAGLAVFALAGLVAVGPLVQQVDAVRTLHGASAALVAILGFVSAFAALAILWGLQVARVGRELRRLQSLRAAAGP